MLKQLVKYLFLTIILTLSILTSQAQLLTGPRLISGNAIKDLKTLLSDGIVVADIMDSVKSSPRQLELMKKFREGISKNGNWFGEYIKKFKTIDRIPYHPNMEMTEAEYQELLDFTDNVESVASAKERIKIVREGNTIRFQPGPRLNLLKDVQILLETNEIKIADYTLHFADTMQVKTEKNALQSKWKGYSWKYESPGKPDPSQVKDPKTISFTTYSFTIGVLEKTGKIFMQIQGNETYKGMQKLYFNIPLLF